MTKSVLLIDSHAAARGMLRFALELQGYRIAEAENLADAAAALTGGSPDLLVIGVDPVLADSFDLIEDMRRRPGLDGLPIVLVGEDSYGARWDLHAIGKCAWLNKPFRLGELTSLIDGLLGSVTLPADRTDRYRNGNA